MKIRLGALVVFLVLALAAAAQPGAGPDVTVQMVPETDAVHPGTTIRVAVLVNLGEDKWHVNAHVPSDPFLIPTELSLGAAGGLSMAGAAYPESTTITLEGTGQELAVYGREFVIGVLLNAAPDTAPGEYVLEGALRYQACDERQCMPPKSLAVSVPVKVAAATEPLTAQRPELFEGMAFDAAPAAPEAPPAAEAAAPPQSDADWRALADAFDTTGSAGGYLNAGEFLRFLDQVESGAADVGGDRFAGMSLWLIVLTVVGGGLLLNLTPCVLPLIPINIAIIGAGARAGSRARGFLLGAVYGLAIAVAYGALGLVVILGVSSAFGQLNAAWWFNGAIAVVFVALSLAMFDVFLIDFTRFQAKLGVRGNEGRSLVVAYLMGTVSALLAGACVAPVVISTIVYAQNQYAQGRAFALFLPFLLGLGMAMPWPFAGAGLSFLPKPGKWMERVKYAFGVLILLFAAYYGYLAWSLFSARYLVDREAVKASVARLDEEGWHRSLAEGLAAAKAEGKPVFVDFWATWCKNCLTMNETTFRNEEVRGRLERYVKIKYQAEDPSEPETAAVMQRYGAVGLPTYVTLKPR